MMVSIYGLLLTAIVFNANGVTRYVIAKRGIALLDAYYMY